MANIKEQNDYSKEVQDMLDEYPNWTMRYGAIILFIFNCLIISLSWFVKVSDASTIKVNFSLYQINKDSVIAKIIIPVTSDFSSIKIGEKVIIEPSYLSQYNDKVAMAQVVGKSLLFSKKYYILRLIIENRSLIKYLKKTRTTSGVIAYTNNRNLLNCLFDKLNL